MERKSHNNIRINSCSFGGSGIKQKRRSRPIEKTEKVSPVRYVRNLPPLLIRQRARPKIDSWLKPRKVKHVPNPTCRKRIVHESNGVGLSEMHVYQQCQKPLPDKIDGIVNTDQSSIKRFVLPNIKSSQCHTTEDDLHEIHVDQFEAPAVTENELHMVENHFSMDHNLSPDGRETSKSEVLQNQTQENTIPERDGQDGGLDYQITIPQQSRSPQFIGRIRQAEFKQHPVVPTELVVSTAEIVCGDQEDIANPEIYHSLDCNESQEPSIDMSIDDVSTEEIVCTQKYFRLPETKSCPIISNHRLITQNDNPTIKEQDVQKEAISGFVNRNQRHSRPVNNGTTIGRSITPNPTRSLTNGALRNDLCSERATDNAINSVLREATSMFPLLRLDDIEQGAIGERFTEEEQSTGIQRRTQHQTVLDVKEAFLENINCNIEECKQKKELLRTDMDKLRVTHEYWQLEARTWRQHFLAVQEEVNALKEEYTTDEDEAEDDDAIVDEGNVANDASVVNGQCAGNEVNLIGTAEKKHSEDVGPDFADAQIPFDGQR